MEKLERKLKTFQRFLTDCFCILNSLSLAIIKAWIFFSFGTNPINRELSDRNFMWYLQWIVSFVYQWHWIALIVSYTNDSKHLKPKRCKEWALPPSRRRKNVANEHSNASARLKSNAANAQMFNPSTACNKPSSLALWPPLPSWSPFLAHSCARMRKQWMSIVGMKCRRKVL